MWVESTNTILHFLSDYVTFSLYLQPSSSLSGHNPGCCVDLREQFFFLSFLFFFFFLPFLGPHLRHMEVLMLGLNWSCSRQLTPQPQPRQIRATSATYRILNPLSQSRHWTLNLMVPSQIPFCCALVEAPENSFSVSVFLFMTFGIYVLLRVILPLHGYKVVSHAFLWYPNYFFPHLNVWCPWS